MQVLRSAGSASLQDSAGWRYDGPGPEARPLSGTSRRKIVTTKAMASATATTTNTELIADAKVS